jgi:hypothetical protein
MAALAGAIAPAFVAEFGSMAFLKRLSDPYWFQALSYVPAFGWHSGGVATTVAGALKECIGERESELGLFVAEGKVVSSWKTLQHICMFAERYSMDSSLCKQDVTGTLRVIGTHAVELCTWRQRWNTVFVDRKTYRRAIEVMKKLLIWRTGNQGKADAFRKIAGCCGY